MTSKPPAKRILRKRPSRDQLVLFRDSGLPWGAWWESLSENERIKVNEELDLGEQYANLIDQATPDDAVFERIRKEIAEGFDPWAAHTIADLCVSFYLKKRLEERQGGRRVLEGINSRKQVIADASRQKWLEIGSPLRSQYPSWSNSELAKRIVMKLRPGSGRPSGNDPLVGRIRKALPVLGLGYQARRNKK